jgi:hypothetical protein
VLTFGEDPGNDNRIQTPAESYPQSTPTIYASFEFEGMTPDTRWLERWLRDGQEDLVNNHDTWEGGESGVWYVGITNRAGLTSGHYHVDIFIEGNLLASGEFAVEPGGLPPMDSHVSTDVGVTINYPLDWNVTDLADNEVSVVAVRDPGRPTFFGVTAWVAPTGTDEDIFDLFELNFDSLREKFPDLSTEDAEEFVLADWDGWMTRYNYTNDAGEFIQGAVLGVQTDAHDISYMVLVEAQSDDWDAQLDLFNVMLKGLTIDEE